MRLLLLGILLTIVAVRGELNNTCGDCWCITDSECPAEEEGISDSIPESISNLYATFEAANLIPLQAPGGGDCFPFKDVIGSQLGDSAYAESEASQCQKPNSTDGFCAFVFEGENSNFTDIAQCQGRSYSLETFSSKDAVPTNAAITHKGPCGVCSSAQDLARRMALRNDMAKIGQLCGTDYYLNSQSFDTLIGCYLDEGFTRECSKLWAHFTATNGLFCAQKCISNTPPFNGDPPECSLNECLTCGEQFRSEFDLLAGRSMMNSGLTEQIARNCSDFYPVTHDPCPGVNESDSAPAPTPAPGSTPSGAAALLGISLALFTTQLASLW